MGIGEGGFLMVFNRKRGGWEMPGGSIEDGETPEEAAIREFREESGYDVEITACRALDDCYVCLGTVRRKMEEGEMESGFFRELPSPLSFAAEEYGEVLRWGRDLLDR